MPGIVESVMRQWGISPDGDAINGHCSLVIPVRTAQGVPAVVKIGFPDEESEHEHLALRRWGGRGAVRLLSADPRHRALLLERLEATDLTGVAEYDACRVVAGLYRSLHVPALPALRPLASSIERWTADLAQLPRSAPIPTSRSRARWPATTTTARPTWRRTWPPPAAPSPPRRRSRRRCSLPQSAKPSARPSHSTRLSSSNWPIWPPKLKLPSCLP